MKFDQPKLTDLCQGRRNRWRSATGGKITNDRAEQGKSQMRNGLNKSHRQDKWDGTIRCCYVPVCKQCGGALMISPIRVFVNQFMHCWSRHGVQQQHKNDQQNRNDCFADRA